MKTKNKTAHPSLRQRLLLGMAIGFIVIICIFSIGLWRYANDAANRSYDRLLAGGALAILERISLGETGPVVDIPYSALQLIGLAKDDRVFYRISGPDNVAITGKNDLPELKGRSPSGKAEFFDAEYNGEMMRFIVQSRFLSGYSRSQWITVQIGQTRIARNTLKWELIVSGLAISILTTIGGLLCVWYGINRALYPLIGIEKELRERAPTDFTSLPSSPPREVESLIKSINELIFRHKKSLDNSQNFIADVAHQTRTSLSALKSQLEMSIAAQDANEQQMRMAKTNDIAERTIHLTNQLLSHAMVIHRSDNQPHQKLCLEELVIKTLKKIVSNHVSSDIEFSLNIQEHINQDFLVNGDEISLREAFVNIVENAIEHGPQKNKVGISLSCQKNKIVLTVEDGGPGIPAENRMKVFERFTSFSDKQNRSGLGLAIVEEVANAHDAEILLEESELGGLKLSLSFGKAELHD